MDDSAVTTDAPLTADELCAAAIEPAREALIADVSAARVGEHLGVEADDERVVTHLFACIDPAYVGWRWAVTVARADGSDLITIDETVMLPGPGSLLSPQWLPWDERVQPGDLGVGDVLPTAPDDPRLMAGFTGADLDITEDDDLAPVGWELGLGRERILSPLGLDEAVDRWVEGDGGPLAPIARAAAGPCSTCGFLIAIRGVLGPAFGLCANEFSPSDGRVVTMDHGCGAHSEAEPEPPPVIVVELVVDDLSADDLDTSVEPDEPEASEPEPEAEPEPQGPEPEPAAEAATDGDAETPAEFAANGDARDELAPADSEAAEEADTAADLNAPLPADELSTDIEQP